MKILAYALAISVALNVAFLVNHFTKTPPKPKKVSGGSLASVLSTYIDHPKETLYTLLGDSTPIEEGYTSQDLALASLVARHKFDIERALGVIPPQQRHIALLRGGEEITLTLYPGLTQHDHLEISHFAKTEVWPLTAEGLFLAWPEYKDDQSLKEALARTPDFRHAQAMLATRNIFLKRDEIIAFLSETHLPRAYSADESGCRAFLFDALDARSQMAASLLIEYDREYALTKLSDDQLLLLLDLSSNHPSIELIAKTLLCSIRSDAVRQGAGEILYTLYDIQNPYDHEEALKRFLPNFFLTKTHVVESGDTLWDLARRYNIDIETLKTHNKLESTDLKPGMKLELP